MSFIFVYMKAPILKKVWSYTKSFSTLTNFLLCSILKKMENKIFQKGAFF